MISSSRKTKKENQICPWIHTKPWLHGSYKCLQKGFENLQYFLCFIILETNTAVSGNIFTFQRWQCRDHRAVIAVNSYNSVQIHTGIWICPEARKMFLNYLVLDNLVQEVSCYLFIFNLSRKPILFCFSLVDIWKARNLDCLHRCNVFLSDVLF